jgi:hypothetical protein
MRILSLIVPKKERLEVDSKSLGCIIHAGSSPASGTILKEKKPGRLPRPGFFHCFGSFKKFEDLMAGVIKPRDNISFIRSLPQRFY